MSQLSKAAYDELLDYLKTADESFLNPDKELGPQTHIEGYLHTTHLLSCAMDFYINSDPDFPEFLLFATPVKKILGDNVDSIYKWTQLRGNRRYKISGRRTNQCYLGFTVYRGPVDGSWSTALGANVNHTHIEFAEDGSFEFILSPNPSGPNEYLLEEDANGLITREYFFDRATAIPAELKIEVLDFDGRPQPITDEELATRIKAAKTFMAATYAMLPFPATFLQNMLMPPFEFGANGQTNGWGTPDNVYAMGNYKLEDDEVLVISFKDHPATSSGNDQDAEWQGRLRSHQLRRPQTWETLEIPVALPTALDQATLGTCLLIDSLGTWLANVLEQDNEHWQQTSQALIQSLNHSPATVILVAEETGWGIIPAYPSGRLFRDRLGTLVRQIGNVADAVYLVGAGYALNLKVLGTPVPSQMSFR